MKSSGKGSNTFKLSGGGAASISADNRDDPIAKAEALVICEMFGGNDGNGGKNDIIKLASPLTKGILATAAETDENLKFCLNVSTKREITWAESSNKVVSREVTRIGDVVLDEKSNRSDRKRNGGCYRRKSEKGWRVYILQRERG